MTGGRSYGSPGAFRRALTDKLRDLATRSLWTLQQLQRQMAYDRLLERLYLVDEGWIIKGATALLARDIGVRGTDTTANIAMFAIAAHADEREAHVREVERSGRSLPEGSYGRRNRQAIATRETRIAARLRAVEQAYRSAIEHEARREPSRLARASRSRSPEHATDRDIEFE